MDKEIYRLGETNIVQLQVELTTPGMQRSNEMHITTKKNQANRMTQLPFIASSTTTTKASNKQYAYKLLHNKQVKQIPTRKKETCL